MYIKKFNLGKLRQAVPIFGAKLWNEIPGRMREVSKKKTFKRKLNSVLFEILKAFLANCVPRNCTGNIMITNVLPYLDQFTLISPYIFGNSAVS